MRIELTDKVAIVTGAGKGIGREILLTLAREGATTIAFDVSQQDLDTLGAELAEIDSRGRQYQCDVRDLSRIQEIVAEVHELYGSIDVLVNNAGVAGDDLIEDLSEDTWDLIHDVNVKGVFLMCKAVIPVMKHQNSGRIINAASFAAIVPRVGSTAYASSKAAVAHFTRGLAGELGPWNITVNSYAPGMVPTTLNHFTELPQEQQDSLLNSLSIRRWGKPEEIANLICFLASDLAGYITGAMIDVSGGKLATQFPQDAYR